MRVTRFSVFLAPVAALFLAACQHVPPPAPPAQSAPSFLEKTLADAAMKSSAAMATLAQVEATKTPPAQSGAVTIPDELKRPVTLDWSGPMTSIAAAIADQVGYTFTELGSPSPTPVLVTVKVEDRPVYEVLEDIGLQAGRLVTLAVNVDQRRIEVRHGG